MLKLAWLRSGPPLFTAGTQWTPLLGLSVAILIFAAAFAGGRLVLSVVQAIAGQGEPAALSQHSQAITFLLGMQATIVGLTLLAAGSTATERLRSLALAPSPKGPYGYVEALAGMLALVLVYNGVAYGVGFTDIVSDLKPFIELMRSPVWALAVLAVAIGAPVSEELLFRGFLLPALARSPLGFRGAALLSTLAWTALHAGYTAAGLLEVFVIGLYLSWLLWRTGSLRVPLVCHALYNTLISLVLMVATLPT